MDDETIDTNNSWMMKPWIQRTHGW